MTLAVSPTVVEAFNPFTATANVSSGGAPVAGVQVRFLDGQGTTVLGSAVTDSAGNAQISASFLPPARPEGVQADSASVAQGAGANIDVVGIGQACGGCGTVVGRTGGQTTYEGTQGEVIGTVTRLGGANRDQTATTISRAEFVVSGTAKAAVLARDDQYVDALAGTPLATSKLGPLLLTPPDHLDAGVGSELQRAVPAGATVYLLGGTSALSDAVASQVGALGFQVQRVAGPDRFSTAVAVADALGDPTSVFEATGTDTTGADALCAGGAAAANHGVVLLTDGSAQADATSAYLTSHSGNHYAVGGPAVSADPAATPVSGPDRYSTCVDVAGRFFTSPKGVGVANGSNPIDALAGGAALADYAEPVLLVDPALSGRLPTVVGRYLKQTTSVYMGLVLGLQGAIDDPTAQALVAAAGCQGFQCPTY